MVYNREAVLRWRKTHPEEYKASRRRTYAKYREEILAERRLYNKRLKEEIVQHYGGKCVCCGETEIKFLTLDHINEDGFLWRKQFGRSGTVFYQWVKKMGFPKNLQLLCWNCNCAKHYYGKCPHKEGS